MAIYSNVFLTLIEQTMDSDWVPYKKNQYALISLIGLGCGSIVGSIVFGKI